MKKYYAFRFYRSIGTQTLEVVRRNPTKVVSLAAHSNITLLKQQIDEFARTCLCL